MKRIAKAAASIALAAAVTTPAFAAGKGCKASFTSNGNMHVTKFGALKSAREVWQAQVRAQYGAEFANWSKAKATSSACQKESILFNFTCSVSAMPCK